MGAGYAGGDSEGGAEGVGEPTTLVGAVRSLNSLNDGRATAAQ